MIKLERAGAVATIRIDRESRRNALDLEHCEQLQLALDKAVDNRARCIVITGEGSAFCAGADLDNEYGEAFREALYGMLSAITEIDVPVIAAVNGPAIGAGTQLAIACDLRVAAPTATFAVPTAKLGLAVDPWTVRRLALLAGGGVARLMLLVADAVTAERAHHHGLVDRLGSVADAQQWADQIAELAPLSLAYAKQAVNRVQEPELADDPVLERAYAACWASEDVREGQRARAQRRAPRFEGR